jgi:serine protease Do
MQKFILTIISLTLTSVVSPVLAVELPDFVALAKKCSPAIVNISTKQNPGLRNQSPFFNIPQLPNDQSLQDLLRRFLGDPDGNDSSDYIPRSRSLGSGFFISADGYILTNYHVVSDADEIVVRTNDRREFEAKIIGSDKRSDTALIKIEIKNAPVLEIGSSKNLQVGDWVLAIGSPFGFDHSVTQGIVSALNRNLPTENYVPFIQTDVAINPGNSGGPLINLEGKVVGINSQIYSRTGGFMGLSFAVPIDIAHNVATQLKSRGYVSRGWLGVMIQDVTRDLAESFGMTNPKGALVAKVLQNSPAESAGIRVGDVILTYNGQELSTSATLPPLVGESPIDRPSTLRILRDGTEQELKVTISELPDDAVKDKESVVTGNNDVLPSNKLGLVIRDLTAEERSELGIGRDEGAVVERVVRNSIAKEAGLQAGDVILMFNNQSVVDGADGLRKQIENLSNKRSIAVLVQRGNERLFLALQTQ